MLIEKISYICSLFFLEKLNIKFVDPSKNSGLLSETERANVKCLHEQHRNLLRIPRR